MFDVIVQFTIVFTGGIAIFLTQQNIHAGAKRYACLFGLVGQPFWFWTSYQSEQWGVFVMSVFYAFAWMLGFYNQWIKKS